MSDRVSPFRLVDKLIDENYRIAIPCKGVVGVVDSGESFITSPNRNSVELGTLLEAVKIAFIKTQKERDDLKRDLKRVVSNGSVRRYFDSYYDNYDACDESDDIRDKWFVWDKYQQKYKDKE